MVGGQATCATCRRPIVWVERTWKHDAAAPIEPRDTRRPSRRELARRAASRAEELATIAALDCVVTEW